MINCCENDLTSVQAGAHVFLIDQGLGKWIEPTLVNGTNIFGVGLSYPSHAALDVSRPWGGQPITSLLDLNAYSDCWVPDLSGTARSPGGGESPDMSVFPIGKKGIITIRRLGKG